jgi:hypothetical protein
MMPVLSSSSSSMHAVVIVCCRLCARQGLHAQSHEFRFGSSRAAATARMC